MGSAGYSAGKLVGGPISDLLGGKGTLACMLAIMGVAKLAMAQSSRLSLMTVAWVAARVAHALTWPGVMLMIRPWFLGACSFGDRILCMQLVAERASSYQQATLERQRSQFSQHLHVLARSLGLFSAVRCWRRQQVGVGSRGRRESSQ